MEGKITNRDTKQIGKKAMIVFLLTIIVFVIMISIFISNKSNLEKMTMEQVITENSRKIEEIISRLLYKTEALSAVVTQNNGKLGEFDTLAESIMDDPSILCMLFAPDGVVAKVYPQEGNESLIGYDLLGEGAGNKEAILAKEMDQLVFGGPFTLVQGGEGLVGRLPVWLESQEGNKYFWGLVTITLKYPQVLEEVSLHLLEAQGYSYQIWRINPDDNEKQVIARSVLWGQKNENYMEKEINILNATWNFRIAMTKKWYHYQEYWVLILCGIFMSFLVAFIVQKNEELKVEKIKLEQTVDTDILTQTCNRRGLFDKLEHLILENQKFWLYYIDLNHFTQINDTYDPKVGDDILVLFCEKIKACMADNDILSRIGGDEFILVCPDTKGQEDVDLFWENVENEFRDKIYLERQKGFYLTFSKGLAVYPDDGVGIEELIACAGKKMDLDKQQDR
ncbi:sensor domain-containing diguanylate cyclase [Lachnospiraceae bacterium ZAX-1]